MYVALREILNFLRKNIFITQSDEADDLKRFMQLNKIKNWEIKKDCATSPESMMLVGKMIWTEDIDNSATSYRNFFSAPTTCKINFK